MSRGSRMMKMQGFNEQWEKNMVNEEREENLVKNTMSRVKGQKEIPIDVEQETKCAIKSLIHEIFSGFEMREGEYTPKFETIRATSYTPAKVLLGYIGKYADIGAEITVYHAERQPIAYTFAYGTAEKDFELKVEEEVGRMRGLTVKMAKGSTDPYLEMNLDAMATVRPEKELLIYEGSCGLIWMVLAGRTAVYSCSEREEGCLRMCSLDTYSRVDTLVGLVDNMIALSAYLVLRQMNRKDDEEAFERVMEVERNMLYVPKLDNNIGGSNMYWQTWYLRSMNKASRDLVFWVKRGLGVETVGYSSKRQSPILATEILTETGKGMSAKQKSLDEENFKEYLDRAKLL
jgi:hypothetical protein